MADRNEVTAACIRYFWDAVWGSTEYPRRRTTWSIIRDHLNRNMHFSLRARLDWLERNMDEIEAFYETRDQAMYDLQSRELSTELLLQAFEVSMYRNFSFELMKDLIRMRECYKAILTANRILRYDVRNVTPQIRHFISPGTSYISVYEQSLRIHLWLTGFNNLND